MATSFESLPLELIENISGYLDTDTFFATRLASRRLERGSWVLFAKRHFRKRGFFLTSPSLEVLSHIAADEELVPYVQHIWFNPDCFPGTETLLDFDEQFPGKAPRGLKGERYAPLRYGTDLTAPTRATDEHQRRYEAFRSVKNDYHQGLHTGRTLHVLTTVLIAFPNLRTIGMRRSEDHAPWGCSAMKQATGLDPRAIHKQPRGRWGTGLPSGGFSDNKVTPFTSNETHLFVILVKSLAASKLQLRRFYTDVVEIDMVDECSLPSPMIQAVCRSVKYLEFNVGAPIPIDMRPQGREPGTGLTHLLNATPDLRELGLSMLPGGHLRDRHGVNDWRDSDVYMTFDRTLRNVQLHHLRRIKLENFVAEPEALIAFLRPSSHLLTSLKLRNVRILGFDPTWELVESDDPAPRPWRTVFSFLAESCLSLSYLLLHHLSYDRGGVRFVKNVAPTVGIRRADRLYSDDQPVGQFTDYFNITVECGVPHCDPDLETPTKKGQLLEARKTVNARVRSLVDDHWYDRPLYTYEMDNMGWHTDTSDEEW